MGACVAVVDDSETKNTRMPKMYVFRKEFDDLDFLGLSWEVLQGRIRSLLACLRGLWSGSEPSWGHLERL